MWIRYTALVFDEVAEALVSLSDISVTIAVQVYSGQDLVQTNHSIFWRKTKVTLQKYPF